jgi:hypothetical protein
MHVELALMILVATFIAQRQALYPPVLPLPQNSRDLTCFPIEPGLETIHLQAEIPLSIIAPTPLQVCSIFVLI